MEKSVTSVEQNISIVGAWSVTVEFGGASEEAVQSFNSDGVNSIYTTGAKTTAFGAWKPTGNLNEFTYMFHEIVFGPGGRYGGYIMVTQTGALSDDGKVYKSRGGGQFYTPEGVAAGTPSDTHVTGTRIGF